MSADSPSRQMFCLQMFPGFYSLDLSFCSASSAQVVSARRQTFTGFVCSWHWLYVWMWIHLQHEMCLSAPTELKEACFSPVLGCFALSLSPWCSLLSPSCTCDGPKCHRGLRDQEDWGLKFDLWCANTIINKIILLIYIQKKRSVQSDFCYAAKTRSKANQLRNWVIFVLHTKEDFCLGLKRLSSPVN